MHIPQALSLDQNNVTLCLTETLESQQEELHRAQAEELQRRDQVLHEQLLKQKSELREAHHRSLNEM